MRIENCGDLKEIKEIKENDTEIDEFTSILKKNFPKETFGQYIEINESDFMDSRINIFYIQTLKMILDSALQKSGIYQDSISVFNENDPRRTLQAEIFRELEVDICWGFKTITASDLILRPSSLTLVKEGKNFISEMIKILEKIEEPCLSGNLNATFRDYSSVFDENDLRFDLITKYLAITVLSLKLNSKLNLPDVRNYLKQGILIDFAIFTLFHDERDKFLKKAKKIIIEFPDFKNEIIKQALLNGKIDFVDDYYMNANLLDIEKGSQLVNRLVFSKKFLKNSEDLKGISSENSNLLSFISAEGLEQNSYLKKYFRKIMGSS